MRTTTILGILLIVGLSFPAGAQDKKADPKKKTPPEPKTWMCKKGDLLWEEKWEGSELPKDWYKGKGNWVVESGALKGAELPADAHHAYTSRKVTEPNAIIQFSFKLDGAKWMGGFFDGKEHVSALSINADSFNIKKMSGIGPTSKSSELDSTKMKLNDGAWHSVVWEIYGDEMVAAIDDQQMVLAKADGLSSDRNHLELNTGGGQWALFKDVKIWKAELDDKWPQKRAVILQAMKKKAGALGYK
ncbi:MAG TPA: LamG domain-containing protein [Planctomycetota bacterium]|nr:LamG domain-containing protein [Planctomycetota bacterium]